MRQLLTATQFPCPLPAAPSPPAPPPPSPPCTHTHSARFLNPSIATTSSALRSIKQLLTATCPPPLPPPPARTHFLRFFRPSIATTSSASRSMKQLLTATNCLPRCPPSPPFPPPPFSPTSPHSLFAILQPQHCNHPICPPINEAAADRYQLPPPCPLPPPTPVPPSPPCTHTHSLRSFKPSIATTSSALLSMKQLLTATKSGPLHTAASTDC